jgi:uncharacterized protein (DUF433 family)
VRTKRLASPGWGAGVEARVCGGVETFGGFPPAPLKFELVRGPSSSVASSCARHRRPLETYARGRQHLFAISVDSANDDMGVRVVGIEVIDRRPHLRATFVTLAYTQGGKPVMAGTRVPVELLVMAVASGDGVPEIASAYRVTEAQVLAAYAKASTDAIDVLQSTAGRSVSSTLARFFHVTNLPPMTGDITKVQDRWRYGMTNMGRDTSQWMPSVPDEYKNGARYNEVMSWGP